MINNCHHVMPSGLHCQSPAMRGSAFCYHHARRIAPSGKAAAAAVESRIEFTGTLDSHGIAQAIHQILNALGSNRISPRRASVLLFGLQMATSNPQQPAPTSPEIDFDQLPPEVHALLCRMMTVQSDHVEKPLPSISPR